MALTGTSDLYIVELVIYLLLFPITFYLAYRHGWTGALGHFYLNVTCAVRIVADIISLLPENQNASHPTISTAILSSIGLSHLLLAWSGFLHEAHVRVVEATKRSNEAKRLKRWLWVAQIQIHGVSVIAMVLAIVGNIRLATPDATTTQSDVDDYETLRRVGSVLSLVVWVVLTKYTFYIQYAARQVPSTFGGNGSLSQMIRWLFVIVPWLGLRCIYSVIFTFDKDPDLSPITGALWVKVVFITLATLGAVAGMCMSSWLSRYLANAEVLKYRNSAENIQYESVMVGGKK